MEIAQLKFVILAMICQAVRCEQTENVQAWAKDLQTFKDELRETVHQQSVKILKQNEAIAQQKEISNKQSETITMLTEEMQAIKQDNLMLKKMVDGDSGKANTLDISYNSTAYGCDLDVLSLTCENSTFINITSAYYGQYATGCNGCCSPDSNVDCQEAMAENRPSDWLALKYACDGKSQCEYQNLGTLVESCDYPYEAHYLVVYYDCMTEASRPGPVAFTAYATQDLTYTQGGVIFFDAIITNLGDAYDPTSGQFQCPRDGVYAFTVSVGKWEETEQTAVDLIHEGALLVAGYGGDGAWQQGAATAVVECKAGERVWAAAHYSETRVSSGSTLRSSSFSGYLVHSY